MPPEGVGGRPVNPGTRGKEKSQRGAGLSEAVGRRAASHVGRRREAGRLVKVCHVPLSDATNCVMTQGVGAHSILPDRSTFSRINASHIGRLEIDGTPDWFSDALRAPRLTPTCEWPMADRHRALASASNGQGPWWNAGASHMSHAVPFRFSAADVMGHGTLCVTPARGVAQAISPDALHPEAPLSLLLDTASHSSKTN